MVEALIHILAGFVWMSYFLSGVTYTINKALNAETHEGEFGWSMCFLAHVCFTVVGTLILMKMLQAN